MKDPRPLGPRTRRVVRFAECTLVWTLCAGLLIQAPGLAFAENYTDPGVQREKNRAEEAKKAKAEFLKTKILRNADDPVMQYLFDTGTKELTNMGQVMFNMLSQTRGEKRTEERAELKTKLDAMVINLREAGTYSPKKRAEVEKGLKDIGKRYGDLVGKVSKGLEETDAFSAELRLNTMFDAMSVREQKQLGPSDVRMHKTDSGTYVYNKDGKLLYKFNNNRVIIFNSAIQASQVAINKRLKTMAVESKDWPKGCPSSIRESGRYQHDLLKYSWCDLKMKVDSIGKLKRRQRVIQMAALVGHQLSADDLGDDGKLAKLEAKLASEQITSGTWLPGWAAKAGRYAGVIGDDAFKTPPDFIDKKFVKYNGYLVDLNNALDSYQASIDAFKGADTVTNDQLKQLKKQEFMVSRFMALTQMEALKVQTEFMLETLSYEAKTEKEVLKDGAGNTVYETDDKGNKVIDEKTGKPKPKMVSAGVKLKTVELSPDSLSYVKAVRTAGLSPEKQRQMFEQWHKMAGRFARLTAVYNNVGTQLEYADVNSKLSTPNRALRAAEAELQVLQRDYSNLMQMPQLMKFAHDQAGNGKFDLGDLWHWTPPVTRFFAEGINAITGGETGWDVAGKYVRARNEIDRMSPKVEGVVNLLAEGKYRDAAVAVVAADTDAHATHIKIGLNTKESDIKITDKATAVLAKYQENLGTVQKLHVYTGIPIDIVKWSVVLGGGSRLFSKFAKTGQNLIIGRSAAKGVELGGLRRGAAETLKQVQLRFDTLGPEFKAGLFKDTAYRIGNAGIRVTSFAAMIAPIGGSVTVLQHLYDGEKSQFGSVLEAAGQGSVHTMKWAAENPWILFVNIPYTAFSGTKGAGLAESLANKGIVGNAWAGGVKGTQGLYNNLWRRPKAWLTGQSYTRATFSENVLARTALNGQGATKWLDNLAERGIMGRTASGTMKFLRGGITNIDHVGKFWAVGQTAGYVGHHLGYNLRSLQMRSAPTEENQEDRVRYGIGSDLKEFAGNWMVPARYEPNEERRIKRAIQTGHRWSESYVWMLLPMHPAQSSEVQDAMQNKIGVEQYLKSKDTATLLKLANADAQGVEGAKPLKMLQYQKAPLFQRIMTMRLGRRLKNNEFFASREGIEVATKNLLRKEVKEMSGGKIDPHMSPWKYLEMLSIEDGAMLGRIRMREFTRNALVEQAEIAFKKNPHHAKKILQKNPSEIYEGVTISRPLLEDVALVVRHAAKHGGKAKINPFVTKAYKGTVTKAEAILEPYTKSRAPRDAAAKDLRSLLEKLNQKGERSEALKEYLNKFSETVETWALEMKVNKTGEHYTQLLKKAEAEISQTKGLNKGEVEAVKASIKYLRSVETRFNYFNNGESFVGRAGEAYDVAINKAKSGSNASRLQTEMSKMREKIDGFLRKEGYVESQGGMKTAGKDAKLTTKGKDRAKQLSDNPGGDKFTTLVDQLKTEVKVLEADPTFSGGDLKIMKEFIQNVDGAPWLLRNSKGYNLKGWRPVQFESLSWFMRSLLEGNATSQTLRVFLKLKTGGGKTLVATEGMWSFIEADAKAQGRTPVLLTPQENLVQQMEAELKATRNYGEIKVTTWSKLNAELAQRKVGSGGDKDSTIKANSTEELYIVSDEYDAPFLAPATTIGQQLATISRVSEGLNIIRNTSKRMSQLISDPYANQLTQLRHYTQTMRDVHAAKLVDHPGQPKLLDRIGRIDKAVIELTNLKSKTGLKGKARTTAINTQLELIRTLVEGKVTTKGGVRRGGLTDMVEGMKVEKPWGNSGQKSIETGIKALEAEATALTGKKPGDAAKLIGRGGKITQALKLIESIVVKKTGGIIAESPSAIALRSETASFRTRLNGLEKRVSVQNQTLTKAAESIKLKSAEVEGLRVKLKGHKYGTEAHKATELQLKRAEVGLRKSVHSVRDILSETGQKELVNYSSGDAAEAGTLRVKSYNLRRKLGVLTAEVSPGKAKVNQITTEIVEHAGRQGKTLRNAASRQVLNLTHRQSRILHSRPPEHSANLERVSVLAKELVATAKDPSKVKVGEARKPGLIDRLRGRDAIRSEMEEIFGQQKQAMDYSKMDTRAQMKELTQLSSKLRRLEAGPKAQQVEGLVREIKDLSLQRQILRKDGRSTKAVDRQIEGLRAKKGKLSRTPLADEVQKLADQLGKDATPGQASRVDAMIESVKVRLQANAQTKGLVMQAEKVQVGLRVRERVVQNTKDIRTELKTRQSGWRQRVNELVKERSQLFEKAVSKKNAVYDTYQRMMDAMASDKYGFLSHQGTVHAEYKHMRTVLEAPETASRALQKQSKDMMTASKKVHEHYKRVHEGAKTELAKLKGQKASRSAIELGEAKVKEAKLRLDTAREARIEAQMNHRLTRSVADRLIGLNDYAPEAKGPNANKLKTMRAEMFRMVEEAASKNLKISKLKAKKHASNSPEAKELKKLEGEVTQIKNRLEGFEKQVVQLNRQVAREAIEQKLNEAEAAESRAEFKVKSAETPEMQRIARRELTLARLEKRVSRMLVDIKVKGVKNASVEFQSLKQTKDATTARRGRLNKELQKELDKKEGDRNNDKIQRAEEQLEWLNSIDKELGREIFQFQQKTALEILDMAQQHAGSSGQKWRPKLDKFIGENPAGSIPTELVRLQTLRTELMARQGEAGKGRKIIDVEASVDAQLAKPNSSLRRLATEADGTVGKLAESAKGLNGKGLPKTVRDAAVRFEKSVKSTRHSLEGKSDGYSHTNGLKTTHGTATRLVSEMRKALENPNLPRAQRTLLNEKIQSIEGRLEGVQTARTKLTVEMDGIRNTANPNRGKSTRSSLDLELAEVNSGIRALEGLRQPLRSMVGEPYQASKVHKTGKITVNNNQVDE